MEETYSFRLMETDDIDQILEIEYASFPKPWSRTAFQNELTTNHFATYIVLESNDRVIGYCGMWVIIDEAHITNIALMPLYRGKKLGEKLMSKAMEVAKGLGAEHMTLEVRVSNTTAQRLYRKLGFKEGGIRKNYYTDNLEDAYVMWVNINDN
jgi:[ribosomal protein S18]-alanine N-acetyltransferase